MLFALGDSNIPDVLLKGVRFPQRRWNEEGEIEAISAAEYGLPVELICLLSNEIEFCRAAETPGIIKSALEDGTLSWSLQPDIKSFFSKVLLPQTINDLGGTILKLICFACPPCYEGNTNWYTL